MNEMNFIPYWYYERIRNKKLKIFNILCVVILVCDIAVFYHCLLNIKKYRGISQDIRTKASDISAANKNSYYKVQPKHGIDKALDIYEDSIHEKIEYSNVELSNKTINIQIPVASKNTSYNLISILDGINESTIQGIESDNDDKSSENIIKVELKIK